MIDWLHAIIDVRHEPLYGGFKKVFDNNDELLYEYGLFDHYRTFATSVSVKSHGIHSISYVPTESGAVERIETATRLEINGNITKCLTGQNIAGSGDGCYLLELFLNQIYRDEFLICARKEFERVIKNVKRGDFVVRRVDCTINYLFDTYEDAWKYVGFLSSSTKTRSKSVSNRYEGTAEWSSPGRWKIKAYHKGAEIQGNSKYHHFDEIEEPIRSHLLNQSERMVRFELELHSKEIKSQISKYFEEELYQKWLSQNEHNFEPDPVVLMKMHETQRKTYLNDLRISAKIAKTKQRKICKKYAENFNGQTYAELFRGKSDSQFLKEYREQRIIMSNEEAVDNEDISTKLGSAHRGTYLAWRAGVPINIAARTFRRHKAVIKEKIGVDISIPFSDQREYLSTSIRTINISECDDQTDLFMRLLPASCL